MTDVNPGDAMRQRNDGGSHEAAAAAGGLAGVDRDRLIACVELLFFAYRDFTNDPDKVLEQYGFGRAHHRVLHFVHRNPGLRVADLLHILKITKQSLARVLKQLIDEGFVTQKSGKADRRERLLHATPKGARLAEKLTLLQMKRIEAALAKAGPGADDITRRFLFAMIGEQDRGRVEELIRLDPLRAAGAKLQGLDQGLEPS
ncbi:MAG: MarR family winged helix-turn-helix transcriptional regulator [Hyphomicrobiaceae bacterium]